MAEGIEPKPQNFYTGEIVTGTSNTVYLTVPNRNNKMNFIVQIANGFSQLVSVSGEGYSSQLDSNHLVTTSLEADGRIKLTGGPLYYSWVQVYSFYPFTISLT